MLPIIVTVIAGLWLFLLSLQYVKSTRLTDHTRFIWQHRLVLLTVLLIPITVFSSNANAGELITGQTVTRVETGWSSEALYVSTAQNVKSSQGCGPRFRIELTNPMIKTMTALLASAINTGSKVDLYVTGCISSLDMSASAVALTK